MDLHAKLADRLQNALFRRCVPVKTDKPQGGWKRRRLLVQKAGHAQVEKGSADYIAPAAKVFKCVGPVQKMLCILVGSGPGCEPTRVRVVVAEQGIGLLGEACKAARRDDQIGLRGLHLLPELFFLQGGKQQRQLGIFGAAVSQTVVKRTGP